MRISVVIPVHEDRAELERQWPPPGMAEEVIVVDSSARDPVRAEDLPERVTLRRSEVAHRAHQQNLGAELARGEAIVFLHADTRLAAGALEAIAAAMEDPAVVGGGFERVFDSDSRFLAWTCGLAATRGRRLGWFLGDQAIFVRRTAFAAVGGFRLLDCFEDYDLCRRLKRCGVLRCLRPPVVSSARRFGRDGAVRRSAKDLALTALYCVGGSRLFRARQSAEIKAESLHHTS